MDPVARAANNQDQHLQEIGDQQETEIRRRTLPTDSGVGESNDGEIPKDQSSQEHKPGEVDSEDVILTEEHVEKLAENLNLPQATDKTTPCLDSFLSNFSARWRNWVVRGIFSCIMVLSFCFIISKGPLALMATVLLIQVRCFWEIISIGHAVYRVHDLPWFRTLSWYLLLCSNYYICGEYLIDYIGIALRKDEFLHFLVVHHRFISYTMYMLGFIWFVLSLQKGYYMRQFSVFALTHVTLVLIVVQSFAMISNLFQGMVWFLVPASMIVCNDIMAYLFGFFFGKTKLIALSPKKTWEGFLGGGVSTVIFGLVGTESNENNPVDFIFEAGRTTGGLQAVDGKVEGKRDPVRTKDFFNVKNIDFFPTCLFCFIVVVVVVLLSQYSL